MNNSDNSKVIPIIKDTYSTMILNSVESKLFQNFYAEVNDIRMDVMRGGELSCAFFVSSITTILGLSKNIHAKVDSTVKDLLESGWVEIPEPRSGSILVWESENSDGEEHKHIGFCVDKNVAISNSYLKKVPTKHSIDFDGKRRIIHVFWNEKIS